LTRSTALHRTRLAPQRAPSHRPLPRLAPRTGRRPHAVLYCATSGYPAQRGRRL